MSTLLQQLNEELAQLNERVLDSLVQVHNGQRGAGAGSIWHADGLIVTNAHVVLQHNGSVTSALSVTLRDGRELPARVLAHDAHHDLAALRIDATNLRAIELGDSKRLHAGDLVLALGFPFGVKGGATSGVVIGSGANLPELGDADREWIAASLHLRPGHSGGPLVDSRGRLVGINTLMTGPEVGVAVPVHVAVQFLKDALGRPHAPATGAVITL
jgi:serine protease Do